MTITVLHIKHAYKIQDLKTGITIKELPLNKRSKKLYQFNENITKMHIRDLL